jgi:hypothetical protein
LPREYLRSFSRAGRAGLAHLGFGARAAAHLFERRAEAEEVVERLRRRTVLAQYDYLVEEMPPMQPRPDRSTPTSMADP